MLKMTKTRIQINEDIWKCLNSLKSPGESFDEVLKRLYKMIDVVENIAEHIKEFPGYPNLENIPLEVRYEILDWINKLGNILANASPTYSQKRLPLE